LTVTTTLNDRINFYGGVAEWKRARRTPASRETEALKQRGSSHLALVSLYYPVSREKERETTYDPRCRVLDGKLRDFIATAPARGTREELTPGCSRGWHSQAFPCIPRVTAFY